MYFFFSAFQLHGFLVVSHVPWGEAWYNLGALDWWETLRCSCPYSDECISSPRATLLVSLALLMCAGERPCTPETLIHGVSPDAPIALWVCVTCSDWVPCGPHLPSGIVTC